MNAGKGVDIKHNGLGLQSLRGFYALARKYFWSVEIYWLL